MIVNSPNLISNHTFSHKGNLTTVSIETEEVCLGELLEVFERYLLACGFVFSGHIDIVEDEIETPDLT